MDCCKKNLSNLDRGVRAVIGILLVAGFALNYLSWPWNYVILVVGLVLLFTAAIGSCMIYSMLGFKTN